MKSNFGTHKWVRRLMAGLLAVVLCLTMLPVQSIKVYAEEIPTTNWSDNAADAFSGGEGTVEEPYLISSASELALWAKSTGTGEYYEITQDIDLSAHLWVTSVSFEGHLDGVNHKISGLIINSTASNGYLGFTRALDAAGSIKNVNLVNVSICVNGSSDQNVGGITGQNAGSIENCSVTGKITVNSTGTIRAGGIVGRNYGFIKNCSNAATVSGTRTSGTTLYVGGIAGNNQVQSGSAATIINCYNMGNISSSDEDSSTSDNTAQAGGITANQSSGTTTSNCYNVGVVTSTSATRVGSLVGRNNSGTCTNVYWLTGTHSTAGAGTGIKEVTAKTADYMKSSDFLSTLNANATTLASSGACQWEEGEDDYPILAWQKGEDEEIVPTYVARIGESKYETLQEAITAANTANQTTTEDVVITLLKDVASEEGLVVSEGIKLDLNGNDLTASSAFSCGGNIVDDSADKTGVLKVSKGMCVMSKTNSQMPVYNGTDGYVFADITKQEAPSIATESDSAIFNLIFRPFLGSETAIQNALSVEGNGIDNQFNVIIRLTWMDGTEQKNQDLEYTKEMVQAVYGNSQAFYINASGVTSFEGLTITPMVVSDALGVTWSGSSFTNFSVNGYDVTE